MAKKPAPAKKTAAKKKASPAATKRKTNSIKKPAKTRVKAKPQASAAGPNLVPDLFAQLLHEMIEKDRGYKQYAWKRNILKMDTMKQIRKLPPALQLEIYRHGFVHLDLLPQLLDEVDKKLKAAGHQFPEYEEEHNIVSEGFYVTVRMWMTLLRQPLAFKPADLSKLMEWILTKWSYPLAYYPVPALAKALETFVKTHQPTKAFRKLTHKLLTEVRFRERQKHYLEAADQIEKLIP